jgi:hypothetical protein
MYSCCSVTLTLCLLLLSRFCGCQDAQAPLQPEFAEDLPKQVAVIGMSEIT